MQDSLIFTFLLLLPAIVMGGELVQGASLFRHGSRYHLKDTYDGGETKDMWGQLTAVGMRQHYNLGQFMRQQYVEKLKFLRPNYNHSEIEVFSTPVDRTLDSATSQLLGLFPDGTGPSLPKDLNASLLVPPFRYSDDVGGDGALPKNHQTIAIKAGGIMSECTNKAAEQQKNLEEEHATVDEMNTRYQPFLAHVAQIFNLTKPVNIVNVSELFDAITVDQFLNRPLPAALTEGDYQNLRHLHYFTFLLKFTRNLSKAITTPKLKRVLAVFDNRIANSSGLLKWSFMSGHDTEIFPSLNLLNISSSSCIEQLFRYGKTNALNCEPGPEFASSLIFELYKQTGNNYNVMIRYNGKYVYLCEQKRTTCDYNEWKSRVQKNFIDPYPICGAHDA